MRVFTVDGVQYCFNYPAFRSCIDSYAKSKNMRKGKTVEELSGTLSISVDSINNWQYGKNGPADLDSIKKAAEILDVDWKLLMISSQGGTSMKQLTDRQKDAVKRIYDMLIWFLEKFRLTCGFNDWWLEAKENGSNNPVNDTYERIDKLAQRIWLVINQEYFDLHGLEIYDELCEFTGEDLTDTYNCKLDYSYRFEADGETAPTVWQDYEKAMRKLNEIIEKYVSA